MNRVFTQFGHRRSSDRVQSTLGLGRALPRVGKQSLPVDGHHRHVLKPFDHPATDRPIGRLRPVDLYCVAGVRKRWP